MRRDIVHVGANQLTYEIREVVAVANQLKKMGRNIVMENIGDPVNKGEQVPTWIREKIAELAIDNNSYGYCDSRGIPETRRFLAEQNNKENGPNITAEDIIFFNGLGDAVAKLFGYLRRESRVIGPSPAYSTHSSAEAAHSGYEHLTYELDENNGWMPDLEDLENKVKYNDSIAGILIINPDNPTGAVYPHEVLQKMVDIARRYDIFVICDEIYGNILYDESTTSPLREVIGDVAGIAMRGISKEYPWPGARCGWIEVYNADKHPNFKRYVESIVQAKMLEVCSTTLPQLSIPLIMGDERYPKHLEQRAKMFEARAKEAWEVFDQNPYVTMIKPKGAFYGTVCFKSNVLNAKQELEIEQADIETFIKNKVVGQANDKRFTYYLLGKEGICVVPLSGFCSKKEGFRITLLENDDAKRLDTWIRISNAITSYVESK